MKSLNMKTKYVVNVFFYPRMRPEFVLGTSILDIAVNILNVAEDDAFEAQVVIRLPPMVTYVKTLNVQAVSA